MALVAVTAISPACDPQVVLGGSGLPAACDATAPWTDEGERLELRLREAIDEARRIGGRCGSRTFPPQPPLTHEPALTCAARLHSRDMADDRYLGYVAPDDLGVADRIDDAGYDYGVWVGSVGAGWTAADHALDHWLAREDHCWKLFAGELEGIGVGVHVLSDEEFAAAEAAAAEEEAGLPVYRSYWTLVLAAEVP